MQALGGRAVLAEGSSSRKAAPDLARPQGSSVASTELGGHPAIGLSPVSPPRQGLLLVPVLLEGRGTAPQPSPGPTPGLLAKDLRDSRVLVICWKVGLALKDSGVGRAGRWWWPAPSSSGHHELRPTRSHQRGRVLGTHQRLRVARTSSKRLLLTAATQFAGMPLPWVAGDV